MATNNDDAPTLDEQARSLARLGAHAESINDPALRAFVERIMARAEALTQEAQGAAQSGQTGKEGAQIIIKGVHNGTIGDK